MATTSAALYKLEDLLASVQDVIDEATVLSKYSDDSTNSTKSTATATKLKNLLEQTTASFEKCRSNISTSTTRDVDAFNNLAQKYTDVLTSLENGDDLLLISDNNSFNFNHYYESAIPLHTESKLIPPPPSPPIIPPQSSSSLKSVRFKQNLVELSPTMPFAPYKDTIVEDDDEYEGELIDTASKKSTGRYRDDDKDDASSTVQKDALFQTTRATDDSNNDIDNPTIDMSNRQIFIHNQQQFEHHDRHLDQLHKSVKQQRHIALTINGEVSDQFELLNDLESSVDRSNTRLIQSTSKIQQYREALRKRTDWMLIIILTCLLLFLLLVLK
jgi:hypothetical protein